MTSFDDDLGLGESEYEKKTRELFTSGYVLAHNRAF